MHVEESHVAFVNRVPQVFVRLVRGSERDRVRTRKFAVDRGPRRGARDNADLERTPSFVLGDGFAGDGAGDSFGRARRSESREPDHVAVLDHRRDFVRGLDREQIGAREVGRAPSRPCRNDPLPSMS
eukprot:Amastigsp_a178036_23.p5 type:complete len:127 gc:universal Amastigsp_a178036_23:1470-1850(+)